MCVKPNPQTRRSQRPGRPEPPRRTVALLNTFFTSVSGAGPQTASRPLQTGTQPPRAATLPAPGPLAPSESLTVARRRAHWRRPVHIRELIPGVMADLLTRLSDAPGAR